MRLWYLLHIYKDTHTLLPFAREVVVHAFFRINFFKKDFQEHYQSQFIWIQIRTDIMSVLIWVKTVCKGYQKTNKVPASKGRVNWVCFVYRNSEGSGKILHL